MALEDVKRFAKRHEYDRVLIEIDGEKVEFEVIDWANADAEDKRELLSYFFTFESAEDFEGLAGAAWLSDFLPFATTGDIDDDAHARWDDIGGGGLLAKIADGSIHYFYHEMDTWPRQMAQSFAQLQIEVLPED